MMEQKRSLFSFIVVALFMGFIGGALGVVVILNNYDPGDKGFFARSVERTSYVEESQTIHAIEEVQESVVSILVFEDVANGFTPFFGYSDFGAVTGDTQSNFQQTSGGTGFVVTTDGLILTNKHVLVNEAANYKVVFSDGRQLDAEIVSKDIFDDVGVLKIVVPDDVEMEPLPVVKFGDSDDIRVGQRVLAIGNALALYSNTVTSGIISATGRQLSAYDNSGLVVENFSGLIQTDAAINLGNSGGPLVNLEGEVVGMNVAVAEAANGIGFAIPINDIKPLIDSVKENGEIVRPVLGLSYLILTEEQAKKIDANLSGGALVVGNSGFGNGAIVPGGAAEEAGIQERDLILSVDGVEINKDNHLNDIIRVHKPGDVLDVRVWRDGALLEFDVTLKSSKDL